MLTGSHCLHTFVACSRAIVDTYTVEFMGWAGGGVAKADNVIIYDFIQVLLN